MDNSTLIELIEACLLNDGNAFRKIVVSHQSMIHTLAFRLLCDEEEAKDAVQETFVRVWENLHKFDRNKKFSTWIYAIATNLCYDKLRAKMHFSRMVSIDDSINQILSSEDVEQNIINSDLAKIISALTDSLTPKQKIVFTLRDLETLEIDEISQITGLSAGKIKSNLFLARQAIRNKLDVINN